jgi:DNA-binding XRE family transcriptional regulator
MTKDGLRTWRKWMGWSQRVAAEAIGVSRASLQLYEKGDLPVPKPVELACEALTRGVRSYEGPAAASISSGIEPGMSGM